MGKKPFKFKRLLDVIRLSDYQRLSDYRILLDYQIIKYMVGLINISGMCVCACGKEMLLKVLQSIALKVEIPSSGEQCSAAQYYFVKIIAFRMGGTLKRVLLKTQFNAMF